MNALPVSPGWARLADLPDKEGFAGSYAGTSHDTLLVAGGANFPEKPLWEGGPKIWSDKVFVLKSPDSTWEHAGTLPHPYAYGASVSIPEGMLCIGGSDSKGHRREVYLLSYGDDGLQCVEYPSLPVPLANMSAVLLGSTVFVFGGSNQPGEQDACSTLYSLDISKGKSQWRSEEELPGRGRFLFQMGVSHDTLFIMGGVALKEDANGKIGRDLLKETWSYSPKHGWQRLPDSPRYCAAAPSPAPVSSCGRFIYLAGGDDGSITGFSPIQDHPGFVSGSLLFDTENLSWTDLGPIPAPRAVLPCCNWKGKAIIVNGELRPGKRSNEVWSITLP